MNAARVAALRITRYGKQQVSETMTKRQLGIGFLALGALGMAALLAVDWLAAGAFQGIGPAQRRGLIIATLLMAVGLSLLPLGDRSA